ncbi:MAG: OsmC family protein [Deltaproteobacteria bacterium]|nr:OsmC family protein [Deltaproteobacteria bacterium]
MGNMLEARIKLINDKIKFSCKAKDNPEIIADYIPPLGNNEGYMPLELFLTSLGACTSGTVLPILRAMRKTIDGFEMKIEGIRREEHPTSFACIVMDMVFQSSDLEPADVEKALKLAKDTYCPVWSMIKESVTIETKYEITKS